MIAQAPAFGGQFPLIARNAGRGRVIEAWEQPARPAAERGDAGRRRVFHQKFGYGTVTARRRRPAGHRVREGRRQARAGPVRGVGLSMLPWSPGPANLRHATELETLTVVVPEAAVQAYEAALEQRVRHGRPVPRRRHRAVACRRACATAARWRTNWRPAWRSPAWSPASPPCWQRRETPAEGWLARSYAVVPGAAGRAALRGARHASVGAGAIGADRLLVLDAGLAFGSGEHGSTRGCLRALELVAHRRPRRILDLGTGSGILAMAAAALLHRQVLGTDIEPWSVRVAAQNAAPQRARVTHPVCARQWLAVAGRPRSCAL